MESFGNERVRVIGCGGTRGLPPCRAIKLYSWMSVWTWFVSEYHRLRKHLSGSIRQRGRQKDSRLLWSMATFWYVEHSGGICLWKPVSWAHSPRTPETMRFFMQSFAENHVAPQRLCSPTSFVDGGSSNQAYVSPRQARLHLKPLVRVVVEYVYDQWQD